jgi:hypothetical protein
MKHRKRQYPSIVAITVLVLALLQSGCILAPPPENKYKRFEGKEVILKENQSLYENSGNHLVTTNVPYVIARPNRYGGVNSWLLQSGTTLFIDDIKHVRTLTVDGWIALGHVEVAGKRRDFEFDSSFSLLKLKKE